MLPAPAIELRGRTHTLRFPLSVPEFMRPKDLFQQLALILDDSPRNISALIINQLPNGIGLCHGEKLPRAVMVLLSYLQRQREREGERETERERQTDRDRQTGRQAGRQTGRQADRQTDTDTDTATDTHARTLVVWGRRYAATRAARGLDEDAQRDMRHRPGAPVHLRW